VRAERKTKSEGGFISPKFIRQLGAYFSSGFSRVDVCTGKGLALFSPPPRLSILMKGSFLGNFIAINF
jgi:hypothetical protein